MLCALRQQLLPLKNKSLIQTNSFLFLIGFQENYNHLTDLEIFFLQNHWKIVVYHSHLIAAETRGLDPCPWRLHVMLSVVSRPWSVMSVSPLREQPWPMRQQLPTDLPGVREMPRLPFPPQSLPSQTLAPSQPASWDLS